MQRHVDGKRVLDLFSYVGGWGVQALAAGASEVTCVDSSEYALDVAIENAKLNNAQDKLIALQGDAFDSCKALIQEQEKYDVIIVDPPAFIARRKDIRNGERAYGRINNLAMRLLNKNGILISASCSMHLERASLVDIVRSNARELDRNAQVIEQGHQGPDHPIHSAIVETEYLKSITCRILPGM